MDPLVSDLSTVGLASAQPEATKLMLGQREHPSREVKPADSHRELGRLMLGERVSMFSPTLPSRGDLGSVKVTMNINSDRDV